MGPLKGLRIIEIAGIGPGPFAGMLLADMGAEVIRIERPTGPTFPLDAKLDFMNRGKRCISLNLKHPQGIDAALKLCESADGLIEGFRPGVTEKLGIGPEDATAMNERLVYGRMTGWGQQGPWAREAGHDINYIAISGALYSIGEKGGKPILPLTLVGDFGGGGMLLAYGMVCALLEAKTSGKGQVVDASILDGSTTLMATFFSTLQTGFWQEQRGSNILDGGAPFYDTYECSDGEYIAIGAIEPQFYSAMLSGLGLSEEALPHQMDQKHWPEMKAKIAAAVATRSRDEWAEQFSGKEACVTPVLKMSEVAEHQHVRERGVLLDIDGVQQPAPAPRFSRTQPDVPHQAHVLGADNHDILSSLGLDPEAMKQAGAT